MPTIDDRLTLSVDEAARLLGISRRTLWKITSPHGALKCVRIGARILYPRDEIDRYLRAKLA